MSIKIMPIVLDFKKLFVFIIYKSNTLLDARAANDNNTKFLMAIFLNLLVIFLDFLLRHKP